MIVRRPSSERGLAQHGWLESRHTFSFAGYHDPQHMGFRALRVLNEDRVEAGKGFAAHSHRDMEIISYVLEGALEHRDSIGNGSVIERGDVQLMRASTGITHSEYNHSRHEPVHFLQIWIVPDAAGLAPAYEQRRFERAALHNTLRCVATGAGAGSGAQDALHVHQDVSMSIGFLDNGRQVEKTLAPGRHAWIQVAAGRVRVNAEVLDEGDGAAVSGETRLELVAETPCEILLFDLA